MSDSSKTVHPFFQSRKTRASSPEPIPSPKKIKQSTLSCFKKVRQEIPIQDKEITQQSNTEELQIDQKESQRSAISVQPQKDPSSLEDTILPIAPTEPGQAKLKKSSSEKANSEKKKTEKPKSGKEEYKQTESEKLKFIQVEPEQAKSRPVESEQTEPKQAKTKRSKSQRPSEVEPKQKKIKRAKFKETKSEETKSEETKSEETKSEETKSEETTSKDIESEEAEPKEVEPKEIELKRADPEKADKQTKPSQSKKSEPKKPFAFTRKPPVKYPKLLSEEPLKAETSTVVLRPFQLQESLKREQQFNFYGRIKQKTKSRHDHEFSRLDRAIYQQGHLSLKKAKPALPLTQVDRTENTSYIQKIIQSRSWWETTRLKPNNRPCPKSKMQCTLHGEKQVRKWLDEHFSEWHSFPSCIRLLRMVTGPKSPNRPLDRQRWLEKYRPKTVDGLLGSRHNHVYLKNWLHQMKIEPTAAPLEETKKTRKKKKEMDNEDLFEFNDNAFDLMMKKIQAKEDSGDDDFMISPAVARKKAAKQQQQQEESAMRSNIVLIVGDYGVGKTAMVYTAAEQEGYEVFEVNAGSKRSGKDIVSALGEMTKSHLVTFHKNKPELKSENEDDKKKKRRLNPFLSSKGMNTPLIEKNSGVLLNHFVRKKQEAKKKAPESQGPKQSLILLEEVDLLFDGDKGFWPSVIELSQSSKRPIIMTCNDPDQIPFENLCLQTVLNIQPPTIEELLPYLWLMCYGEGYQVEPADLICLVSLIGCDIRHLIQNLELYRNASHPFENASGLYPQMSAYELQSMCIPSNTNVDSYQLTRAYKSKMYQEDQKMEQESSLENIISRLENEAFIDTWLDPKDYRHSIHTSTADAVVGYTHLLVDEQEDVLSNEIMMHTTALSRLEESNKTKWFDLRYAREKAFEEDREAIEKILPLEMIYQPRADEIMMEYIPYIRLMLDDSKDSVLDNRKRRTRSRRRRTHLLLSDENVNMLMTPKQLVDETAFIHEKLRKIR